MKKKNVMSLALTASIVLGCAVPAFAAKETNTPNTGSVQVLAAASSRFSSQQAQAALVNEAQTALADLGWCQYLTISFADGYNKDNCTLLVDSTDVTAAVSNVTDDGSIAKWQLTSLNPAELTITSKSDPSQTQTVVLSGNTNAAAPQAGSLDAAPAYILTHAAIPVWDYHLTNYDDNGNVRVSPEKTTFSTEATLPDEVASYSPDAELKEAEGTPYGVSGTVEILFNYNTAEEKEWFDAVADGEALALVSYDENKSTLNGALQYEKSTKAHNGGTAGVLRIPIGQSNFYSNGRYNVRVTSTGHKTAMVPIHVVNETAPSMRVDEPGKIVSGQNVHFEVTNMTYGITIPIETVTLTDPTGATKTLEKIRDWYLLGDLFVLYNDVEAEDGRDNIPYSGVYTLTVHSNGFKQMSKRFEVSGRSLPERALSSSDAVTTASVSGGGSSGGTGSVTMSADLLFNADLLTNALLLEKIGAENEAAQAIVDRWSTDVSGYDAVYREDGTVFYTWTSFNDAVREAKLNGDYLSFAAYTESPYAETTLNRPYAVKEILEDNLLGETQYNGSYKGKTPPELQLEGGASQVQEGKDAVLTGADAAYLDGITEIVLNGNWQGIAKSDYSIADGKLTLSASVLKLGSNTVEIKSDGYKNQILSIRYQKDLEDVTLKLAAEEYAVGEDVVLNVENSNGDFLENLQSVTVNGQTVLTKEAGGGSQNDWYEADGAQVVLKAGLFPTAGSYTVALTAESYGMKTLTFSMNPAEDGGETPDAPKDAPQAISFAKEDGGFFSPDFYRVSFADVDEVIREAYLDAVTAVKVGDADYQEQSWSFSSSDASKFKLSDNEVYGGLSYLDLTTDGFSTAENTSVVILAEGYTDLVFTVDKDGNLVTSESSLLTPPLSKPDVSQNFGYDYRLTYSDSTAKEWLSNIQAVAVNGAAYTKVDYASLVWNDTDYYIGADSFLIGEGGFEDGENSLTISAEGYKDLVITMSGGEITKIDA